MVKIEDHNDSYQTLETVLLQLKIPTINTFDDEYLEKYKEFNDLELFNTLISDITKNPNNHRAILYMVRLLLDKSSIYCEPIYHQIAIDLTHILIQINPNYTGLLTFLAANATKMSERKKSYKHAALNECLYAKTWLARYYLKHNKTNKGLNILKNAARYNYVDAINELGYYYLNKTNFFNNFTNLDIFNTESSDQNAILAFKYYKKSADLGNPTGYKKLGKLYKKGIGVKKNEELAESYLMDYWKITKDYSKLHKIT